MNKKQRMDERILQHGFDLLRVYECPDYRANDLIWTDQPVALSKRLFRLENEMHRANEQFCNGDITDGQWEAKQDSICNRVNAVLGKGPEWFINGDPRGYALKIDDSIARDLDIYRDMGGYGILAPDFRE